MIEADNRVVFASVDGKHLIDYKTPGSAGGDLRSNIERIIAPHDIVKIPSGFKVKLPSGYMMLVKPRSSLAVKKGLLVIDGVIDSDYRGEISIVVHNLTDKPVKIEKDERIAQAIIIEAPLYSSLYSMNYDRFDEEYPSERGTGGFGSTGDK